MVQLTEDPKAALTSTLGDSAATFDPVVFDYVSAYFKETKPNLPAMAKFLSPFFLDAGCCDNDDDVTALSRRILEALYGESLGMEESDEKNKLLQAPVNISKTWANKQSDKDRKLWAGRDQERTSHVDEEKLAKDQAKKKERLERLQRAEVNKKAKRAANFSGRSIPAATYVRRPESDTGPRSRDLIVENFGLYYGAHELINNASMRCAYGHRYGLVGRNGCGKSTLMKAIALKEIDVPEHLPILLVEQEIEGTDTTVIQSVLEADAEREELLIEEKKLLSQTPPTQADQDAADRRLEKIYERLAAIDSHTAESRAARILSGLGFTPSWQERATKTFSGGWRMRIALARALFCEPEVLLLDEPTNHLDLFAIMWLEEFLQTWENTLIVVSHQRSFLNNVCTDIVHIKNLTLLQYKGNYDQFEKTATEQAKQQQKAHDAQINSMAHMQKFVDKFRFNAKRARMAQSRIKKLDKMKLSLVDAVEGEAEVTLPFGEPEPVGSVLQMIDVTFGFSKNPTEDQPYLFNKVNLGVDMSTRIALVGPNGAGKSTLLNVLAGDLPPLSGNVVINGKARVGRFAQHFVEQIDLDVCALEHFMAVNSGVTVQEARSFLGKFGLSGDLALRTMRILSGGQKARVAFALLAWKKPHVLLLDEVRSALCAPDRDPVSKSISASIVLLSLIFIIVSSSYLYSHTRHAKHDSSPPTIWILRQLMLSRGPSLCFPEE
eukprot:TRINITY_DN3948_c0_g1_i2.p1 TRINITY_DN3948_c0_g1~~TRINITY_DN3948_c0_g1_i2.p1  ORF type:complete len:728 (+),score=203.45 TRINITY_DN3948_c0_g1_i2:23-2185(+)